MRPETIIQKEREKNRETTKMESPQEEGHLP